MTEPRRYAEGTEVSVEKSRAEIEKLLKAHGASQFFSAWDDKTGAAMIGFRMKERVFRLEVRDPKPEQAPKAKQYWTNHDAAKKAAHQQKWVEGERMRRWRAQLLLIKAKLEMVATGETTIEREFLADMLTPNGQTVGQQAIPALAKAYATGTMPMLPMFASPEED